MAAETTPSDALSDKLLSWAQDLATSDDPDERDDAATLLDARAALLAARREADARVAAAVQRRTDDIIGSLGEIATAWDKEGFSFDQQGMRPAGDARRSYAYATRVAASFISTGPAPDHASTLTPRSTT